MGLKSLRLKVASMKKSGTESRRTKPVSLNSGPPAHLRDAETPLARALEATTDGYWDWKLDTGEVHYGQGWLSSLGYLSSDLSNDNSFLESIVHPDDLPGFESHVQSHLRGTAEAIDHRFRL